LNSSGDKGFPSEWKGINFEDYFKKGYKIALKGVGNNAYITLRKGEHEESLGPYTDEKWKLLRARYPDQLFRDLPPLWEVVEELKDQGLGKEEVAQKLSDMGFPKTVIAYAGFPVGGLGRIGERSLEEQVKGTTRGPGYAEELKELIRKQISLSREFAEACTEAGVQVVFAALKKTNLATEDLKKIFANKEALTEIVSKTTETALKSIEAYNSDLIKKMEEEWNERLRKLEDERDEARAALRYAVAKLKQLEKALDPVLSVEKMIYTYLMSGNTDHNVFSMLMDKWLELRLEMVRMEAIEK
jgi:arsenate reductase-like glutaredoxin family protein